MDLKFQSLRNVSSSSCDFRECCVLIAMRFDLVRKTDNDASTTNVSENVIAVVDVEGGSDGVSSEGEKAPVAERVQVRDRFFTNFFNFLIGNLLNVTGRRRS